LNLLEYVNNFGEWVLTNLDKLVLSAATFIVVYVVYRILIREIEKLKTKGKLQEHVAYTLIRVTKWVSVAVILSAILAEWGVTLGIISGVFAIFGGTIIGFAAINTLGNALAGLIVMTSRPFDVGDRVFLNGQFADIIGIELIYTKMRTLDNVLVSVPNQELLKVEIDNYGKRNVVRRHCVVTPGFDCDPAKVEDVLLEAAGKVQGILKEPQAHVWIKTFQNYAVEYNLHYFINNVRRISEIDAALHRMVLVTCKEHGIDLSTPLLLKQLEDITQHNSRRTSTTRAIIKES